MKKLSLITFTLSLFATSAAFSSPCDEDYEKFCGDRQPGYGTLADCILSHKNELSYACRQWIDQREDALEKLDAACGTPARDYCRDVRPGFGRVETCMRANFDKLPEACQRAFQAIGG